MSRYWHNGIAVAALALGTVSFSGSPLAQENVPPAQQRPQPQHGLMSGPGEQNPNENEAAPTAGNLLITPLVRNTPGGVKATATLKNPMANDPGSVQRGMQYFISFNCVGCHAANGGGGMGISLSDSFWKFGSDPAQIYNVISHGGPTGMPAWGSVLPESVIWDLVSYVQGLAKKPTTWGTTVNIATKSPAIEQVPAEFIQTPHPWNHTQPFSSGQKPTGRKPTGGTPPPQSGSQ
ncbi:MAG TPA: cytochrome c [Pseudolabrys sp.]|jgi:cytochrome c oxidase cbb3-type subunit 3|nr:cytochrome c [Pseudolabrys sp.]